MEGEWRGARNAPCGGDLNIACSFDSSVLAEMQLKS